MSLNFEKGILKIPSNREGKTIIINLAEKTLIGISGKPRTTIPKNELIKSLDKMQTNPENEFFINGLKEIIESVGNYAIEVLVEDISNLEKIWKVQVPLSHALPLYQLIRFMRKGLTVKDMQIIYKLAKNPLTIDSLLNGLNLKQRNSLNEETWELVDQIAPVIGPGAIYALIESDKRGINFLKWVARKSEIEIQLMKNLYIEYIYKILLEPVLDEKNYSPKDIVPEMVRQISRLEELRNKKMKETAKIYEKKFKPLQKVGLKFEILSTIEQTRNLGGRLKNCLRNGYYNNGLLAGTNILIAFEEDGREYALLMEVTGYDAGEIIDFRGYRNILIEKDKLTYQTALEMQEILRGK